MNEGQGYVMRKIVGEEGCRIEDGDLCLVTEGVPVAVN